MKQLFAIDLHDYDGCTKTFRRPSARGIIIKDGSIALVYSQKEHYYKFPGGGIRPGEDKTTALIREVKEETGLTVIPDSIAEFGSVLRRQRSDMAPDTVFEQENFYYVCRVEDTIAEQNLDDYEREAEFILRFTDIDEAIRVNEAFHSEDFSDEIMIKRELRVLQLLRLERSLSYPDGGEVRVNISDESETIGFCGVDCAVCPDYTDSQCPSCRNTAWTDDDICMPVKCFRERGIAVCGQCGDFPCAAMAAFYEESESHRLAGERMKHGTWELIV